MPKINISPAKKGEIAVKKPLFAVLTLLFLTLLACNFSVSTANINEAKMAKDSQGQQPTTVFAQDEPFYAVVELANASDDTAVKAVWTAVEADGLDPNYVISEASTTSGSGSLWFDLTNDKLWPAGKYKVDLYLNDELARTLEFTVEGDVAAQAPSPTPEPTATPQPTATPAPTSTPKPTVTPVNAAGDSLAVNPTQEDANVSTNEAPVEYEPLPLQPEPYVHPSGAFTFAVPEAWELFVEDEASATFTDGQTYLGAVFSDGQFVYGEEDMQNYIDIFLENYMSFADEYEIIEQKPQPDDSIYVALSYSAPNETGDVDFFFEQRNTIVYVLVFATTAYNELQPTWDEIIASYAVNPDAALAALPTPTPVPATPTPQPVPPTPTPAPVANPFAPQPGQSRLYVFNEFNQDLTFTIDNKQHTIPPSGIDNPIPIDLAPGRYTFTISIPGGAANDEVTLGPNESWAVGVRGDGAVYIPFKVYP